MPPKFSADQIFFEGRYTARTRSDASWLSQMVAGYKASHLTSSFEGQLKLYQSKIGQAEADLQEMIFYRDKPIDKH